METEDKDREVAREASPKAIRWTPLVFALVIVWLGTFLICAIDHREPAGLMTTVMRNWEQYGIAHSKYQFIGNAGGLSAGEAPLSYVGHRPLCLFPSYFVGHCFGGAGESTLPFLLLLSTLTTGVTWFFLGRNHLALACAVIVPLCYGYLGCARGYDPIGITIVMGIPLMVLAVQLICTGSVGAILAGAALMLAYSQLNWPTIFPLASASVYLMIRLNKRPAVVLFVLAVALVGLAAVAYSTVSSRVVSNGTGVAGQSHDYLWQSYLWGAKGYDGNGMTLQKMLVRNVSKNTVTLLPVFLLVGSLCVFGNVQRKHALLSLAPMAIAVIGALGMRNLFGHHSWMAGPAVLCGALFSIGLLQFYGGTFDWSMRRAAVWMIGGVTYCFLLGGAFYGCDASLYSLRDLVAKNTKRDCVIVVMPDVGPAFYESYERWSETFDRKVIKYSDWVRGEPKYSDRGSVIRLSAKADIDGRAPFARSPKLGIVDNLLMSGIHYYRVRISKRAQGDCLEVGDSYFLYDK